MLACSTVWTKLDLLKSQTCKLAWCSGALGGDAGIIWSQRETKRSTFGTSAGAMFCFWPPDASKVGDALGSHLSCAGGNGEWPWTYRGGRLWALTDASYALGGDGDGGSLCAGADKRRLAGRCWVKSADLAPWVALGRDTRRYARGGHGIAPWCSRAERAGQGGGRAAGGNGFGQSVYWRGGLGKVSPDAASNDRPKRLNKLRGGGGDRDGGGQAIPDRWGQRRRDEKCRVPG